MILISAILSISTFAAPYNGLFLGKECLTHFDPADLARRERPSFAPLDRPRELVELRYHSGFTIQGRIVHRNGDTLYLQASEGKRLQTIDLLDIEAVQEVPAPRLSADGMNELLTANRILRFSDTDPWEPIRNELSEEISRFRKLKDQDEYLEEVSDEISDRIEETFQALGISHVAFRYSNVGETALGYVRSGGIAPTMEFSNIGTIEAVELLDTTLIDIVDTETKTKFAGVTLTLFNLESPAIQASRWIEPHLIFDPQVTIGVPLAAFVLPPLPMGVPESLGKLSAYEKDLARMRLIEYWATRDTSYIISGKRPNPRPYR